MKRFICVLCLVLVLAIPASAHPAYRPTKDFAEMVILDAEYHGTTWVARTNRLYAYRVTARGFFDSIECWWTPRDSLVPDILCNYSLDYASVRDDFYTWYGRIGWLDATICRLTIMMHIGTRRTPSDHVTILVLPSK